MKTNAMRLLEELGIPYEAREYPVDPEDLAAETAARKLGMDESRVFKTLAVRGDRSGVMLAVIPAGTRLDTKAFARASGDRRVEPVPLKEVVPLTGYVRGAVTALACKRAYPVFLDESAQLHDTIGVSGGARGLELILSPDDYLRATRGTLAAIAVGAPEAGG